ncbi:MAG: anthranilate synthase component I [Peptococcaceae bacterium]|jgi:anthranilate synthase component 1|nr:anthranilate synthase component I [Peptococcaceae bacterium]MDH7525608.1 anthranilate synthase component I [Peptococcaceae bacterium]
MDALSKEEFLRRAEKGSVVPVFCQYSASFDTPLSIYLKIREGPYSFLLESVERGVQVGRYSFISAEPRLVFKAVNGKVTLLENGRETSFHTEDPLRELEGLMAESRSVRVPGLAGFSGGAVGYLGYGMARYFEKLPPGKNCEEDFPDCVFMFADTLVIYDHVRQVIQVVSNARITGDPEQDYEQAVQRIKSIAQKLRRPVCTGEAGRPENRPSGSPCRVSSNMTAGEFVEMVKKAQEYIRAGDIFQVVLSQRYMTELECEPLEIYRSLRAINPSPYMFFLEMDDLKLVGSSPEVLVKASGGEAEVRPIAGTRPRGRDDAEERRLEEELAGDEKEKAEHLMLVDLGRNDLGRVCEYGSVKVEKFMEIEKYSHVMHLVSRVRGTLAPGVNSFKLLRACFPAGTVSGAPKIRAMEIIEELEKTPRGPYAGAVGYFGYSGDMDTCITIRTAVIKGNRVYAQAGAGIVADSDPQKEDLECKNKAKAMLRAIQAAGKGE